MLYLEHRHGSFQEAHGVAEAGANGYPLATDACCYDLDDLSHHLQVCCGCGDKYAMRARHCWLLGNIGTTPACYIHHAMLLQRHTAPYSCNSGYGQN